jgi:hypothetical protein
MITILIFGALAIDVGHICAVAGEMQHTADGASLAGASAIRDENPGEVQARALEIISAMQKSQGFHSLEDQVIEVGTWNSITGEFTPLAESGATRPFAVRVVSHRSETQYFFAPIIGHYSADVFREAVALGSGPCTGVWGLEGLKAGSIRTDSYDATDGPYDPATAGEDGDLCSGAELTIQGSYELHGDAMAGFGHEVTVNGGSGMMTGLTSSNYLDITPPEVDFGNVTTANDNPTIGPTDGGSSPWKGDGYHLNVTGNETLTLGAGTYYFDSIKLSGGAAVILTGPTKIYVSGTIDATGGTFVNEGKTPGDFEIICSGPDVKISGGTGFFGSILAPYADVKLSGNDTGFYGGLVGKTVTMIGDVSIHVDESLPINDLFAPPQPSLVR